MNTFILIVSYGRTGTTLLREILNTDPNANIQGENEGAFFPLAQFYKKAKIAHSKKQINRTSPWCTTIDSDAIVNSICGIINEGFFTKPFNDTKVFGFKDISYRFVTPMEINDLFTMLNDMYDLRIVFNFRRDKQATIESMLRAKMIDSTFTQLDAAHQFESLENQHRNCVYPNFRIDYEDLFLFKFCGLEYNKNTCKALFDVPHSNNHRPGRFKEII